MSLAYGIKNDIKYSLVQKSLVVQKERKLNIHLSDGCVNKNISLVVDIYDMDNPIHPGGHVGWWSFDFSELNRNELELEFDLNFETRDVSIIGRNCHNKWVNSELIQCKSYLVNIVIRDNITNGIIFINKVPVFLNNSDYLKFRKEYEIDVNFEKYATVKNLFLSKNTIHIVSRNIFYGDAVGNLCLDIYKMLKQNGIQCELHAEEYDIHLNDTINHISDIESLINSDDRILYFYSTFDPYLDIISRLNVAEKIAYYHGITEPQLLQVFDPELSIVCKKAYAQLGHLNVFDSFASNSYDSAETLVKYCNSEILALSNREKELNKSSLLSERLNDSIHDLEELEEDHLELLSIEQVKVIPPKLMSKQSITTSKINSNGVLTFLYVGRIKSHKKIEDILELFHEYYKINSNSQLLIVGSGSDKAYKDYLEWVEIENLKIKKGTVKWLGKIDDDTLKSIYNKSDIYISMSEDEGFCLPILEAMLSNTLVFSYDLAAIREVTNNSVAMFSQKNLPELAQHIHRIMLDSERVSSLLSSQSKNAEELILKMDGSSFIDLLIP
ncbi:glycosyltransferase [Vibrio spartinae]|uniref:Lipopolysaccharide 1,2-N-acetylglucosaminetransferase n=1 Tax=Vibrio spartinae TaxID=1918945 RepID=A0ABX6QV05_9VIBR|nr:glycosyltransferase [Vibrio spartinae]QMV12968.1 lipopolysaccharide 1,2-N-acetylglucosaminetransferase [Vibrio spartinae]